MKNWPSLDRELELAGAGAGKIISPGAGNSRRRESRPAPGKHREVELAGAGKNYLPRRREFTAPGIPVGSWMVGGSLYGRIRLEVKFTIINVCNKYLSLKNSIFLLPQLLYIPEEGTLTNLAFVRFRP